MVRNWAETSSAYSCGVRPWVVAAFWMFSPCSSVPVRKNVSSPLSLWKRVTTSTRIVVYEWPRCGAALT